MENNIGLRELMDTEIKRLEDAIVATRHCSKIEIEAIKEATGIAKEAAEKRLDGMNEIREAMKDQAAEYARRDEIAIALSSMEKNIEDKAARNLGYIQELRESRAELAGKASAVSVYGAFALGLAGLIFGVINFLIK